MTNETRAFRDALGLFPTGVAIVTTRAPGGEPVGATVSSFNSVSLDPPLILFSIARNAKAFDIWANAGAYAVNILGESQGDLSNRFARAMSDKWDGIDHAAAQGGVPLIPQASACFECERYAAHDGGDHVILVGRVVAYRTRPDDRTGPLLFYRGRYRELAPVPSLETPANVDHLLHGW